MPLVHRSAGTITKYLRSCDMSCTPKLRCIHCVVFSNSNPVVERLFEFPTVLLIKCCLISVQIYRLKLWSHRACVDIQWSTMVESWSNVEHRRADPASTFDFVATEDHRRLDNHLFEMFKRWSTMVNVVDLCRTYVRLPYDRRNMS